MKKITIAIIGLGYWGPNVLRNFAQLENVTIKYACDLDIKNLTLIKSQYPTIIPTQNINDILNDASVDAVAIATTTSSHFSLVKLALEASKHVLVEKPFTQTSVQAAELIALAHKKKKILMVGHTFIYTPAVQKIQQLLSQNKVGKLYYLNSTRINLGLIQSDSNVLWDLAVHDLAIFNFILDSYPRSVRVIGSSHIKKNSIEDAHIFLSYPKNISAHIHVSWLSPVKLRTMIIGGSKQMIVYDDIKPSEKIRLYDKSITLSKDLITPFKPAYRSGDVVIPHLEQQEALFNEVSHFIDCIQTKHTPLTDGVNGLEIIKILEACDVSLKENKEISLS